MDETSLHNALGDNINKPMHRVESLYMDLTEKIMIYPFRFGLTHSPEDVGGLNIFSFNLRPVGVSASPPSPVSRKLEGIVFPMRYIAPITSSHGMRLVTPASDMSADTMAREDPPAFRFTQGTSTKPATGSQTRPSIFFNVIAKASDDCCGVPPAISTMAAEAIALADPTSAWHPPAAPEMKELFATTKPNAPAVNK